VLLRDLLSVSGLQLRLLYEPPGALDRVVRRPYTTDLLEPARYLSGGDLVMTGLVWRTCAGDSEVFVKALAEAGAAALAAGAALLGGIPDDVVGACRHYGMPLIEVPAEVSFGDITEYLAAPASAARGARLSASLGRQRRLLSEIVAGRSLADVAAVISQETGHVCRVLTASGRHIVPGPAPLSPADSERVTRAFLTAPRLPVVAGGHGNVIYSVFTTGQGLTNRMTAWFVVVEGRWPDWDPEAADAVAEFAAIAALDHSRVNEGLRAVRHIAAEAVSLAGGEGSQVEVRARLRQAGLDPAQPLIAVVAGFAGRADLGETIRLVLEDVASLAGPPVVAPVGDGCAAALLPAAGPDVVARVSAALRLLAPGAGRMPIAAGISTPSAPAALRGALEQAEYSRRLAELRGGAVAVVTGEEVSSHVLLLAAVPDEVRRAFSTRVLGPVLEYDERNSAGLRQTLQAYLDCSGSWSRTSELLHLHVNTVRYRIERVEQLTGRDLSRLEDRVDIFLALRSL
jgi:PucR-like helix-turn-helix protein/purine catabolism regulatory family protein/diguanylate cyclase with GGDEF domain